MFLFKLACIMPCYIILECATFCMLFLAQRNTTVLENALSKHSATTMNVILSNLKKGVSVTHSWVNNMNFHSRRLPGQRHVHSDFEKSNSFFICQLVT